MKQVNLFDLIVTNRVITSMQDVEIITGVLNDAIDKKLIDANNGEVLKVLSLIDDICVRLFSPSEEIDHMIKNMPIFPLDNINIEIPEDIIVREEDLINDANFCGDCEDCDFDCDCDCCEDCESCCKCKMK